MSQFAAAAAAAAPAPPQHAVRRYLDSRLLEVVLVLYFPVVIAARWFSSDNPTLVGGLIEAVVTAMAWFCLAWVVGWVIWRATRRESPLGQRIFGASLILLMLSSMGMVAVHRPRIAAAEQQRYEKAAVALLDFYEHAINTDEVVLGEGDATIAFAAALERRAMRIEDDDARALTLTGAALMREQAPITDALADAARNFQDAGAVNPATLSTRQRVVERLALARELREAAETLKRSQVLMRDRFERVAALYGMPAARIAESTPWLEHVFGMDENAELAALEVRSAQACIALIRILHEEYGRWEVDPADAALTFHREPKAEAYARELDVLRDAQSRKKAIQLAILAENRAKMAALDP